VPATLLRLLSVIPRGRFSGVVACYGLLGMPLSHDHGLQPPEHEHGHRGGPWAFVRGLVAPHHHDPVGQTDSVLEGSRDGVRALKVSLAVLGVTAVFQAVIVWASGSVALLGDTLHNFVDAATALPFWVAFTLGRRQATRRYTYGFGRAEDLAGIAIVLTIAASAAVAGYEAAQRLMHPQDVKHLGWVAVAAVAGFLGNEVAAQYRIRTGRRIGSAALVADGLHARTDGLTSLGVLLGAVGVALGFRAADAIMGLVITAAIVFVLKDAARSIYHRLMDSVDPELVEQARSVAGNVPGVEGVDELRLRWIGHRLHAEVEVVVDPELPMTEAHMIAHEVHHALLHGVARLDQVIVHTSPASRDGTDYHDVVAHHTNGNPHHH
jgi:cation diffusion facilitator family transporter